MRPRSVAALEQTNCSTSMEGQDGKLGGLDVPSVGDSNITDALCGVAVSC